MAEMKTSKAKRKKRMLTAIGILTLLGILSAVLLSHPEWFVYKSGSDKPTSMYSDNLVSHLFYPSDYELDVDANEDYQAMDRYIHIRRGGEEFAITDENYAGWGEDIDLFHRYFTAAIYADVETYNSLFTENYYKTEDPREFFAPQMIYGITLEKLAENDDGTYVYDVTYAIYRNDGTFRNDIGSDAYKTLIFTLAPEGGELKIDAIDYYRQG
ncbi:MAG: hypothetical protein IJZ08_03255 [Clostridia bacterium]|nr:hypothetical protein [Clostridia bacterium]